MRPALLTQAKKLTVEQQLELVQAIWDSIAERGAVPALTLAQSEELERRLADHEARPEEVESWSEVRAAALAHIAR